MTNARPKIEFRRSTSKITPEQMAKAIAAVRAIDWTTARNKKPAEAEQAPKV